MRVWRGFLVGALVGLFAGVLFVGGYYLGTRAHAQSPVSGEYATLWTVRDLLEQRFIGDPPSEEKQVYGAAHGLVGTYGDPYTVFLEPVTHEIESDRMSGQFGGIGAYVGRNDAGDLVVTVMRDRPAARAGIQDGDILLEVDGKQLAQDMTVEEVVTLIRGKIGTQVELTLSRTGRDQPFKVLVTREKFETPSVEWRLLDAEKGIGYARVALFGQRTAEELRTGITDLEAKGVKKLVVDLRGNGGGLVDSAVDIASLFLDSGNVLFEQRKGAQEKFYPVKRVKSPAQGWELVVLTDGGTASASEIVAGALRDTSRAVLIGEKTFGKGSVQEVHELPDGSSLHVTVAKWLTPARHVLDKNGLEPDVAVSPTEEDRANGRDPQLARAQAWLTGEH